MAHFPGGGPDIIRRAPLSPDTAVLQVRNGPAKGTVFRLDLPRLSLGRADPPHSSVDIDLSNCNADDGQMISRRHAEIEWSNGQLAIRDLGSHNGTFVNGTQLPPLSPNNLDAKSLAIGDIIRLGALELEVDADRTR